MHEKIRLKRLSLNFKALLGVLGDMRSAEARYLERTQALKKKSQEIEGENELILTQLFQVQEELERYFLLVQEKETQINQLNEQLAAQKNSNAEHQIQVKQLSEELDKTKVHIKTIKDLLLQS